VIFTTTRQRLKEKVSNRRFSLCRQRISVLYLLQGGKRILNQLLHTVSPSQSKYQPMLQTNYCSQCGEKRKGLRPGFLVFTSFCAPCKRRARPARLARATIFIALAAASFLAGRATRVRPVVQFIGQPIELQSTPDRATVEPAQAPAGGPPAEADKRAAIATDEAPLLCGAPTKAGHPCRRKVRGSGYCWQHKDQFKAKARTSQ
jgi:hypothetical protein